MRETKARTQDRNLEVETEVEITGEDCLLASRLLFS